MNSMQPLLYVIFSKANRVSERLREARRQAWTVPKQTAPKDLALFYFGGPNRGIFGIGRASTNAEPDVPGDWTKSKHGFFANHRDIVEFESPLYLEEIKKSFPAWKRWNNLLGVRVHIVPFRYRQRLAELIVAKNPGVRKFLTPWFVRDRIQDEGQSAIEGLRTEIITYRQGRNRALRDRALEGSKGICEACKFDFSTLLGGKGVRVLQVHHRKQLASADQPRATKLNDLAVLCANCHMLIHTNPRRSLTLARLTAMLHKRRELISL